MLKSAVYLHHINKTKRNIMSKKIYEELEKAQNECYDAQENKLFDLCQYHIDYYFNNDLSKIQELIILKFAKDVYKIATLKNNLDPLV